MPHVHLSVRNKWVRKVGCGRWSVPTDVMLTGSNHIQVRYTYVLYRTDAVCYMSHVHLSVGNKWVRKVGCGRWSAPTDVMPTGTNHIWVRYTYVLYRRATVCYMSHVHLSVGNKWVRKVGCGGWSAPTHTGPTGSAAPTHSPHSLPTPPTWPHHGPHRALEASPEGHQEVPKGVQKNVV